MRNATGVGLTARLVHRVDGTAVRSVTLGAAPIFIGRSEQAHWTIDSPDVSRLHVALWVNQQGVWIQDLNSANGTFLNDERIERIENVVDPAMLRIGQTVLSLEPVPAVAWLSFLNDERQLPLSKGTYRLGTGEDADIHLHGVPAATLEVNASGVARIRLGIVASTVPFDEPFQIGGHTLFLMKGFGSEHGTLSDSMKIEQHGYPYRLSVLTNQTVQLSSLEEADIFTIRARNRVLLLSGLAQQLSTDRAKRIEPTSQGWMQNDAIGAYIWGERWEHHPPNRLHVLTHRTRRSIETAGLRADIIEKRHGGLRLWIAEVILG
ncbi:MAG: FHA domain-containing protein [Myxococcota bacterium]